MSRLIRAVSSGPALFATDTCVDEGTEVVPTKKRRGAQVPIEEDDVPTESTAADDDDGFVPVLPRRRGRPPKKATIAKMLSKEIEEKRIKDMTSRLKKQMVEKIQVPAENLTDENKNKTNTGKQLSENTSPQNIKKHTTDVNAHEQKKSVGAGATTTTTDQKLSPKQKNASGKGDSSSGLDAILNMQSKMLKPESVLKPDDFAVKHGMSSVRFPSEHNITYHQWSLGGINLLIRCGYHAILKDVKHQGSYVYISPKLEYQVVYGFEEETTSEIARNWMSVYLRPNCILLRARINAFTSEIMLLEEMDFNNLIPPDCDYSPPKAFSQMNTILQKLQSLPVGSYLLTKSPGDTVCSLMKSTAENKRGAYDLHFRHCGFMGGKTPTPIQWIPVNPRLLMPHHHKNWRVPLTFQPADHLKVNQNNFRGKKNKKQKKRQRKQDF